MNLEEYNKKSFKINFEYIRNIINNISITKYKEEIYNLFKDYEKEEKLSLKELIDLSDRVLLIEEKINSEDCNECFNISKYLLELMSSYSDILELKSVDKKIIKINFDYIKNIINDISIASHREEINALIEEFEQKEELNFEEILDLQDQILSLKDCFLVLRDAYDDGEKGEQEVNNSYKACSEISKHLVDLISSSISGKEKINKDNLFNNIKNFKINNYKFNKYYKLKIDASDLDIDNEGLYNLYNKIFNKEANLEINTNLLKMVLIKKLFSLEYEFEFKNFFFELHEFPEYKELFRVVILESVLNDIKDDSSSIKVVNYIFNKIFFDERGINNEIYNNYLELAKLNEEELLINLMFNKNDQILFNNLLNNIKNQKEYNKESITYYYKLILSKIKFYSKSLKEVSETVENEYLKQLFVNYIISIMLYLKNFSKKYCKDEFMFDLINFIGKSIYDIVYHKKIEQIVSESIVTQCNFWKSYNDLNINSDYFTFKKYENDEIPTILSLEYDVLSDYKNKISKEITEKIDIMSDYNILKLKESNKYFNSEKIKLHKDILERNVNSKIYGMENIKKKLFRNIQISKYNKNGFKVNTTLLHGSPGVGKSYLLKVIAEELGLPYLYLSLNGKNSWELVGQQKSWRGSEEGLIAKFLKEHNKPKNAIIILDEVDKVQTNNNYENYYAALSKVLDENLNHNFEDNFSLEKYDLSGISFFLTSNNINELPDYLLNRITLFKVEDYNNKEKLEIMKNFIIDKVKKSYNFDKEFNLTDEDLNYIIKKTNEGGLRQAEKIIKHIYEEFIYQCDLNDNFKLSFDIIKNSVNEVLSNKINIGFN